MAEVCQQPDNWCTSDVAINKTSFLWTINEFSKCPQKVKDFLKSSKFNAGTDLNTKWYLQLFPNGETEADKDFVSIFLYLSESDLNEVKTELKISIIDDKNQIHKQLKGENSYKIGMGWGWRKFIRRTLLEDPINQLLPNDCLTIYCEVSAITRTTSSGHRIARKRAKTSTDDMTAINEHLSDCDVDIVVEGLKFSAHKVVLKARSPVFKAMFENPMEESQQNRVIIEDIDKEVFGKVLRYIYSDKVVEEDFDTNIKLFSAADKYDLKDLKSICEEYIGSQLTSDNVCDVLIMSDNHSAKGLKNKSIEFIRSNESKVTKTKGWVEVIKRSDLLQLF